MRICLVAAVTAIALGGCISTQEMPLTPNSVRIDTSAKGYLFTGQTVPQTMRAAANATIQRGFTRFKLEGANLSQGDTPIGVTTQGNMFFSTQTVETAPEVRSTATVVMFHDDDTGAKDAFVAADVLKQYSS